MKRVLLIIVLSFAAPLIASSANREGEPAEIQSEVRLMDEELQSRIDDLKVLLITDSAEVRVIQRRPGDLIKSYGSWKSGRSRSLPLHRNAKPYKKIII